VPRPHQERDPPLSGSVSLASYREAESLQLAERPGHRLGARQYRDQVTRYRSLGPGDVAAPTSDAVLFQLSVPRALFSLVAAVLAASLLMHLLLAALAGHGPSWDDLGFSLLSPVVGAVVGFGLSAWQRRRRPTWVRVSGLGLELAQHGDPVFIAWSQITAAQVRRRWIFAVLEVTPADLYAVKSALPSRDLPRIRYARGVPKFSIEVGTIRPGLPALRAALARHHPLPGVTQPIA